MRIIGIAGPNGSGKDSVAQILRDDYGWFFVSSSTDLIIPELKKMGRRLERSEMAALTTQWRQAEGMGAVVDHALALFKSQDKDYNGLVVGSLRHPGEAQRVHELGGQVIWVEADPKVRYERIYNRGQGAKDKKSFEEFLSEEQAEMTHSGDEATLNMAGVKDAADYIVSNNSTLKDLESQLQELVN